MSHVVVVHYHEIGLKGRNRSFFERALVRNLKDAMDGDSGYRVDVLPGRMLVRTAEPASVELLQAVGRTFGVATYSPGLDVEADMPAITDAALGLLEGRSFEVFAVAARRGTKEFALTSHDINVALGAAIQHATGAGVNLGSPDVTVYVEVVRGRAFVYTDRHGGPGGLPVGVSGRVMSLLSGGIDSAVATYRMCKRGSKSSLCHFHSYPYTDRAGIRKAEELAGIIASWQGDTTLYLAGLAPIQQQIVAVAPPALRVVLYRRFMVRIAAGLAAAEGAKALVTGESLGQVASQTLENMICIEDASPLLMLRPLVGDDKQEIVSQARRIGTYDLSILPYEDCCSLFVPKSPATRADVEACRLAESELDVQALVAQAVEATEVKMVRRRGGEA